MAYFETVNSQGTVSIGDGYANLGLAQKGQATVLSFSQGSSAGYCTISYTAVTQSIPQLALPSPYAFSIRSFSKTGNTFTWVLYFESSARGATVAYYVFALPDLLQDTGGLFQCFDETGKLIFDSGASNMRTVAFQRYTTPNWSNISAPSGLALAILVVAPVFINEFLVFSQSYTHTIEYEGYYLSGSVVARKLFTVFTAAGSAGDLPSYVRRNDNGGVMVIDVTGF